MAIQIRINVTKQTDVLLFVIERTYVNLIREERQQITFSQASSRKTHVHCFGARGAQ